MIDVKEMASMMPATLSVAVFKAASANNLLDDHRKRYLF